jgi:hypothetical protein
MTPIAAWQASTGWACGLDLAIAETLLVDRRKSLPISHGSRCVSQ